MSHSLAIRIAPSHRHHDMGAFVQGWVTLSPFRHINRKQFSNCLRQPMISFGFVELGLLLLSFYLWKILRARRNGPLPPGPRGWPVIGNLFDIPTSEKPWLEWAKLGEKYGDLVSIQVFGTTLMGINSYAQVAKMFNDKSDIYSDRPPFTMATEVSGMRNIMGALPNGRQLKSYRRMFQHELGTNASVKNFLPYMHRQCKIFVKKIMDDPNGDLLDQCFHHTGSIILKVAYGYQAKVGDDPMIKLSTLSMNNFSAALATDQFAVNRFPILLKVPEWLPGTEWKVRGRKWARTTFDMATFPLDFTKKQLNEGTADDSFVGRWLKKTLSTEEEFHLKWAAASLFGAGAETTALTIYGFVLRMCLNPEIQKNIHEEIDAVVGDGRLPTFEDRSQLHYFEAVIKEIKRFHIYVPHSTSEDDVHEGMFIPKGSIIFANIWLMGHDPSVYKDPMTFDPMRFFGDRNEQDPSDYIFGFGRRLCPGRLLAEPSVFISIAMIAWAFDITPIPGEEPVYDTSPGMITRLRPFKCKITPRKDIEKLMTLLSVD
ncbi:hypothetical protein D9758_007686 [Tetrapyrgos nigripes]|uniref:Cytochrome P450 n=1 Tax=Tetrapyrgos nigripes TaxID=182062 RepID=A0A8H5G5H6_9AGAR|nr:hypothetical protein D9758_007686 [Tetrapyrgos nigripes]